MTDTKFELKAQSGTSARSSEEEAVHDAARPAVTFERTGGAGHTAIHTAAGLRQSILAFVRKQVHTLEEAEDIVQDVLLSLLRTLEGDVIIENVSSWLFRAARNRVIDLYRRRRATPLESVEQDPLQLPEGPDAATREEIYRELTRALSELPAPQRDVFVMHELQGIPFEEIASITGEKMNTLLSRKRYAVLALRKRLRRHYEDLQNP